MQAHILYDVNERTSATSSRNIDIKKLITVFVVWYGAPPIAKQSFLHTGRTGAWSNVSFSIITNGSLSSWNKIVQNWTELVYLRKYKSKIITSNFWTNLVNKMDVSIPSPFRMKYIHDASFGCFPISNDGEYRIHVMYIKSYYIHVNSFFTDTVYKSKLPRTAKLSFVGCFVWLHIV